MPRRRLAALVLAALLAAPAARAEDDWQQSPPPPSPPAPAEEQGAPPSDAYDVSVDINGSGAVSLDAFQSALAPYGDWVVAPSYGQVWRPRVAAGWRPYYYGRWEWTSEGWLWVSDEPWGWATYHYGRWAYDPGLGWIWVPGYQWAPAWVAWRSSGDVVGWAPLAPGFSIYVSSYPYVDLWWTFVPTVRFCSYPVWSAAYAPGYSRSYFYATAPAPAFAGSRPVPGVRSVPRPAWGGPAPALVAQRTGRPITPVRVIPAATPGRPTAGPGVISMYRPESRPAPAAVPGAAARPVPPGGWRGEGERAGGAAPAPAWRGGAPAAPPAAPAPFDRGGRGPIQAPALGGRGSFTAPARGPAPATAPGWSRGGAPAPRPAAPPPPSGGGHPVAPHGNPGRR